MKTLLDWLETEDNSISSHTDYYERKSQTFSSSSSICRKSPAYCPDMLTPERNEALVQQNNSHIRKAVSSNSLRRITLDGVRQQQAEKIFHYLIMRGSIGATGNELSRQLLLPPGRISARLSDLRKILLPSDEPLIITNGTTVDEFSGHDNVVWIVNPSFYKPSEVFF